MEYMVGSDERVGAAVIRAVGDHEQRPQASLPPLFGSVDPDALDALFSVSSDAGTSRTGAVSFVYSNTPVTVHHGEYITVE